MKLDLLTEIQNELEIILAIRRARLTNAYVIDIKAVDKQTNVQLAKLAGLIAAQQPNE